MGRNNQESKAHRKDKRNETDKEDQKWRKKIQQAKWNRKSDKKNQNPKSGISSQRANTQSQKREWIEKDEDKYKKGRQKERKAKDRCRMREKKQTKEEDWESDEMEVKQGKERLTQRGHKVNRAICNPLPHLLFTLWLILLFTFFIVSSFPQLCTLLSFSLPWSPSTKIIFWSNLYLTVSMSSSSCRR